MLNADGTSTAFGLAFRAHDNRQMQHILRAYGRLPENPNVRTILYLSLTGLENSLPDEEAQPIRDWLQAGGSLGEFPGPSAAQGPPIDGDLPERESEIPDLYEDIRLASLNTLPGLTYPESLESSHEEEDDEVDDRASEETDIEVDDQAPEEADIEVDDGASGYKSDVDRQGNEGAHDEINDDVPEDADGAVWVDGWGDPESEVVPSPENGSSSVHMIRYPEVEIPVDWKLCSICEGNFPPEKFVGGLKITSSCKHDEEYIICIECICKTIAAALDDGRIGRVYCPVCRELFTREDVLKYGTPNLIIQYDHLALMANPGIVMCLAPHCGAGQIHPDNHRENPVMTCNTCGFLTCVVHKLPWHKGFSCEEFDSDESQIERLEADELTAKLLSQNSKVCPTCKEGVTKTEGCDHMSCRCGENWCWECLTSWENIIRIGATAHARHCIYHPDKVRLRRDQTDASARNMAELVHGGPVSEALAKAREGHNAKRREKLRPLVLEAAEKRAQAAKEEADRKAAENGGSPSAMGGQPRKKLKLIKPWEEM